MLGPILPLLASQWTLNDAQAGRFFTAQFVAAVTGSLLAAKVLARWGTSWTVSIGMFLVAAGVGATGSSTLWTSVTGIGLYGLGLGFALPATNLLVAELVPERRVAALNLLNFSWTVGALAGPMLIAQAQRTIGWRTFLFLLAASFVVTSVAGHARLLASNAAEPPQRQGKLHRDDRVLFALLTSLFLILYVGVENAFSGWLSAFAIRFHQTSPKMTALMQSSFWCAILVGRLVAPLLVSRVLKPVGIVTAGIISAALGITATLLSSNVAVMFAGVLVCGLGLSAIFPTVVAIFAESYGSGGAGSIVLGMCGVGGATVPWLVGVVGAYAHNLRVGFIVPLLCLTAALITFWRIHNMTISSAEATTASAAHFRS